MDRQRCLEGLQRAALVLQPHVDKPASRQRAEVPRLQFQGLGDVIERLAVVAEQVVHRRPLVPALCEIRRDDDHLVELGERSEEHTSELQSLMRISYAVFCLKKKNIRKDQGYN